MAGMAGERRGGTGSWPLGLGRSLACPPVGSHRGHGPAAWERTGTASVAPAGDSGGGTSPLDSGGASRRSRSARKSLSGVPVAIRRRGRRLLMTGVSPLSPLGPLPPPPTAFDELRDVEKKAASPAVTLCRPCPDTIGGGECLAPTARVGR